VVERSPEKAGVGGSTPSLATIFCKHLATSSHLILAPIGSTILVDHTAQATELRYYSLL
jgi:hypothetical protein